MKLRSFWNLGLCIVLSMLVIGSSFVFEVRGKEKKEDAEESKGVISQKNNDIDKSIKIIEDLSAKYNNMEPTQWGETIDGVVTKVNTDEKVIFLTFDACGGAEGSLYDKELIEFLIENNIQANLFINSRWIDNNMDTFKELASTNLFEIENHGYEHKPLSINGNSIYDIQGTKNVEDIYNEIEMNALKIAELTGKKPKYFRAGTAYYDEVAIEVASDLGHMIAGFDVIGDGGATFTKDQVISECLKADSGSIVILHMNQPNSEVFEGVKEVIPMLQEAGYKFGKLEDYM